MGGGMLVVTNGNVRAAVELPLFGLLSDEPLETFLEEIRRLSQALHKMGWRHVSPGTFEFMGACGSIPYLKITALGLIDVENRRIVDALVH